jgi:glycosyltransferase involved in cell wall biosynthesis
MRNAKIAILDFENRQGCRNRDNIMTSPLHPLVSMLVFSKDRALQLEAMLRTFYQCCGDAELAEVNVIYATSTEAHALQYAALADAHPQTHFRPERNFREDTIRFSRRAPYILLAVDDAVFARRFCLQDGVNTLAKHPEVIGFSYRLGRNITLHYPTTTIQKTPDFAPLEAGLLQVDWTRSAQYFAYPLEVSSSLFRTSDIAPLLEQQPYDHPNTLESKLNDCKHTYAVARPALAFYETSVAFCIPLNVVQDRFDNRHTGQHDWSAEALAARFNRGERLFPNGLQGLVPNSCHQEVPVELCVPDNGPAPSAPRDPFISICIPTYNRERFLAEAVASALAQDYPQFEVLVVDDGSTDGTEAIVRAYTDPRLRYVRQDNGGRPAARNRCVREAKGEFILWLDSDDLLLEGVLRDYVQALRQTPDVDVLYGNLESVNELQQRIRIEKYKDWYRMPEQLLAAMAFWNALPNPGTMVRRHCFETFGLFTEDFVRAQDYEWFTRICGMVEARHVGRIVCRWRHHNHGRATTGAHLEYDCRIVDAMLATHPLQALCPDVQWTRLPLPTCNAICALKFAKRFAELGCKERALAWARKALQAKADTAISRVAAEYIAVLVNGVEHAGAGSGSHDLVKKAATQGKAFETNKVLLVSEACWPPHGVRGSEAETLATGLLEHGFNVKFATIATPTGMSRTEDIFRSKRIAAPEAGKTEALAEVKSLLGKGDFKALLLFAPPGPLVFHLLSLPKPRPRIIYRPRIDRAMLDTLFVEATLPTMIQKIADADQLVITAESSREAQLLQIADLSYHFIPLIIQSTPAPESFRQQEKLSNETLLFVAVADYYPQENQLELLQTMRRVDGPWRLQFMGVPRDQEYFQRIRQAAADDTRVVVTDNVPAEITAAAVRDADLLLLPANSDGYPTRIVQAMRHGTPWLATPQCDGVLDLAGGVIAALESFPQIVDVLRKKSLLRKTLGTLGERHYNACFDTGRIATTFAKLIQKNAVDQNFNYPETLRSKNEAVVQNVLQLSALK